MSMVYRAYGEKKSNGYEYANAMYKLICSSHAYAFYTRPIDLSTINNGPQGNHLFRRVYPHNFSFSRAS